MSERAYSFFGIVGPIVAYTSIGVSIALSPWFRWERNALSDLGHAVKSGVAPVYNLGLLLAGVLMAVYAVTAFRKYARYTSICLAASAFLLQLVATFDEVYGLIHQTVSVLFFVSIGITSIVYAAEKKSRLAVIAFMIGLGSWALYGMRFYNAGIAVPEAISSVAVVSWVVASAVKTYLDK